MLCAASAHPPYELQPRSLIQVIQADRSSYAVAFDGNDIVFVESLFEPAAVAVSNEDTGVAGFGIDEEVLLEAGDVAVVEPLCPLVDLGGTGGEHLGEETAGASIKRMFVTLGTTQYHVGAIEGTMRLDFDLHVRHEDLAGGAAGSCIQLYGKVNGDAVGAGAAAGHGVFLTVDAFAFLLGYFLAAKIVGFTELHPFQWVARFNGLPMTSSFD